MAQTKLISAALAAAVLLASYSCCPRFTWEKAVMDGSRTGVIASTAENVPEAMGVLNGDGSYTSPNGRVFDCGSTPAVARAMISAQPQMADLKKVVGISTYRMVRRYPESELFNLVTDLEREAVEEVTGKRTDVAIHNFGGVRKDIPQGEVMKDDIVSMLPFKNYLCWVRLSGADLIGLFDRMASLGIQAFSGAKIVLDADNSIDTLLVGGKPVDPAADYGVGTIDFLLDGGDGLSVGRNAKELIITDRLMQDVMLEYFAGLREEGREIVYHMDGRVTVKEEQK